MNTAAVIHFPRPLENKQEARKNMYSDKFEQGYVMSSRLYRKEVWPFLSDAARNVYAELENRINGHNKESDFVSYSQLQGGELKGSRQLSRRTVSSGLKELLKLGVISVLADGKQGMKSYRLNEISLKDRFTNETSLPSTPVHLGNHTSSPSTPETSLPSKHTIDTSLDSLENKKKNAPVDNLENEMFSDSVEYHLDNKNLYSLKELSNVYTIMTDMSAQAKKIDSTLDDKKILSELKDFAQWAAGRDQTTAQGWMNYWIYRVKNFIKPKAQTKKSAKPKSKSLSDSQIKYFASSLCNYGPFASKYSSVGESQKSFEARIGVNLRTPEDFKDYGPYLQALGLAVVLEDLS